MEFIFPDWPAPPHVRAVSSTRRGGASDGAFASFNLADHVGDAAEAVASNRERLRADLELPADPLWLRQVHGTRVVQAADAAPGAEADGAVADRAGVVCAVLTADCLPILLCDRSGSRVGVVHAGWRGLAAGVIEAAVSTMGAADHLLAWMGPAIGPSAYEVGEDVRRAFLATDPGAGVAFAPTSEGRWYADLYALARRRLRSYGVLAVYGGGYCTATEGNRFFSFRRDGRTGRMASLIWLA